MGGVVWKNHNSMEKSQYLWFFNKKGECFFLFYLDKKAGMRYVNCMKYYSIK